MASSGLKSLSTSLFGKGDYAKILDDLESLYRRDSVLHAKGTLTKDLAKIKEKLDSLKDREKEKNKKKYRVLSQIWAVLSAINQDNYSDMNRMMAAKNEVNANIGASQEETLVAASELHRKVLKLMTSNKVFQERAEARYQDVAASAAQRSVALMAQPNNTSQALRQKHFFSMTPEQREKHRDFYSRILRVHEIDITQPANQDEAAIIAGFLKKREEVMRRLGLIEMLMDDDKEREVKRVMNREEAQKYMSSSTSTSTSGGRRKYRKSTHKKRAHRKGTRKGPRRH